MSLNNFLLAAIDDDSIVKFLFHKAASIFWKVGYGELHSCILDSDSLVDFAWSLINPTSNFLLPLGIKVRAAHLLHPVTRSPLTGDGHHGNRQHK